MKVKNKIIIFGIFIIFGVFIVLILNLIYNFNGEKKLDEKILALAKIIKYSHPQQILEQKVNGKNSILNETKKLIPNISEVWFSRNKNTIDMFGLGANKEIPKDSIDKEVLKTGKIKRVITKNIFSTNYYRVTIPYKATTQGENSCIQCHTNALEGDVLGSITFKVFTNDSIITVANSAIIALVFMIIFILVILYILISPLLNIFDEIKKTINKVQNGDYSQRINNAKSKEANDIAVWLNGLLEKLEATLNATKSIVSIFLSERPNQKKIPLVNVKNEITKLSNVYKFRKTIAYDETLDEVYSRLIHIFKEKLNIKNFNLFEIDNINNKTTLIHKEKQLYCNIFETGCRANRTKGVIDCNEFKNICSSFKKSEHTNYLCIPYSISNELNLVLSIYSESREDKEKMQETIDNIQDYISAAKTVIVSKKLVNILELDARTDPLTKLYNRKYLDDSINKTIAQAKRMNIPFGVLMVDIDHFKQINDTYGHNVGDNAIQIVAKTLIENTRDSDIVIRFGGEEFIILLYNCKKEDIEKIALKIKKAFSLKKIPTGNNTISKTLSIGTAIYPQDSSDIKECIKYADLALYEAKETGRNKVVAFNENLIN